MDTIDGVWFLCLNCDMVASGLDDENPRCPKCGSGDLDFTDPPKNKSAIYIDPLMERWRVQQGRMASLPRDMEGCFIIKSLNNGAQGLRLIVGNGMGWDHVSVSRKSRMPTYDDMKWAKRMTFRMDSVAMELHVPEVDHINFHAYCLHLWRPQNEVIPMPPNIMVGPTSG